MPQLGLEVRDQDGVRVVRLNRPPANTLNRDLLFALKDAAQAASQNSSVRVMVLGSGIAKYFSAGLDLDEFPRDDPHAQQEVFAALIAAHRALADCPKPTIAAMGGAALLGGFILALGCDFRFLGAERGRVSLAELRLGLSPTAPILRQVFALSASPGLIKELVLKAKTLGAEEALAAGLVDKIFPEQDFEAAVLKEAKALAGSAPKAYAAIKRQWRAAAMGEDENGLWTVGLHELKDMLAQAEAQEGFLAMREKRKPRWP